MGYCFMFFKVRIFFLFDSIEEHDDIFFETLGRNQVLNSHILDEKADVSFAYCHEHIFQYSSEEKFGRVLEELQLEQPCNAKHLT